MWERQLIETKNGQFEIFVAGEGEPLCITHLYSEFNQNGSIYASQFTPYRKVYLVNLRGCGQSTDEPVEENYSMQQSVSDLEAVREALGIETWGFAGHSTGGMLALKYAIVAPESLQFIFAGGLCASSDYMRHAGSIYCKDNQNNKRIGEIIALLRDPNSSIEERRAGSKEWSLMSLHKEENFENMIKRPSSGKTLTKRLDYFSYKELPTYDLRPELPNVKTKAFLYSGLYDAQCPHVFTDEAARLMPNATMPTFYESNHFPVVEEEGAFHQFVKESLEQVLI